MPAASGPGLSLEVVGVKQALRDLGRLEPDARKLLQKDFKEQLRPLADRARDHLPAEPPLSGMTSGRLAWSKKSRSGVKIATSGRNRRTGTLTVAALVNTDAAGSVFDIAGRRRSGRTAAGRVFVRQLTSRFGRPSRSLWPTAERNQDLIEQAVSDLVGRVEAELNRRLA